MVEFELEVKSEDITVRVRGSSKEEVLNHLADAKSILKKVSEAIPKSRKLTRLTVSKEETATTQEIPVVPPDLAKFVEFGKDGIPRISSRRFYDITQIDAIALLLYIFDRPLQPREITRILGIAWKRVSPNSVRDSLVDKTKLRPYVLRVDEGYRLTGEGKNMVKTRIIPKVV